jgi:hypothetical protein
MFCGFDAFDQLGEVARGVVAANEAEVADLARYPVVSGHFALATLTRFAPPQKIATVLREPRARLLSHYLYLRLTPGIRETWHPYDTFTPADRPLDEFLADPRVATATDNKTCRMLLHGDPRVRDGEFIAENDLGTIAEAAWERLERLGFVGLLEDGDTTWAGLGAFFGVGLAPDRVNAIGANGSRPGALPVPPVTPGALALLERRTAADAILYRRVAARRHGEGSAVQRADDVFAAQLGRLERGTLARGIAPGSGEADHP